MARTTSPVSGKRIKADATALAAFNPNLGSIGVWLRKTGTGTVSTIFSLKVDANNEIEFIDGSGNFGLNLRVYHLGAGTIKLCSGSTLSLTTFTHVGASWDVAGTTELRAYSGGSQFGGTQTGLATLSGTRTGMGIGVLGTDVEEWDGQIAEFAHWDAVLTAAEFAALAKGVSPLLVRPGSLVLHAPLYGRASPEPSTVGNGAFTLTNAPDWAPGPGIYLPRPVRVRAPLVTAAAPVLSLPTVTDIGATSVRPRVTLTF